MNAVEADFAIERLLDKHQAWLMQQPELLLIWSQPRRTRKRVASALADGLTTIPVREETTEPNRAMRRRILEALKDENPEYWTGVEEWLK